MKKRLHCSLETKNWYIGVHENSYVYIYADSSWLKTNACKIFIYLLIYWKYPNKMYIISQNDEYTDVRDEFQLF